MKSILKSVSGLFKQQLLIYIFMSFLFIFPIPPPTPRVKSDGKLSFKIPRPKVIMELENIFTQHFSLKVSIQLIFSGRFFITHAFTALWVIKIKEMSAFLGIRIHLVTRTGLYQQVSQSRDMRKHGVKSV